MLAQQRLREAVSEIKTAAKKDPVPGAEGAVRLMEKLWLALEHVDSSSGALGSAVNKALDALIPTCQKTYLYRDVNILAAFVGVTLMPIIGSLIRIGGGV